MRTSLAYYAINTQFNNINITGKMQSPDQMGGLVLFAQSGTIFKNVNSSISFTIKDLDFSKYYAIAGGIAGQITTTDGDTNYEFNKGTNNKYSIIFDNSTFSGSFNTDFTNAVSGNRFYYLGGLFGCTTYTAPASYFAVKVINSISFATYNYVGALPSSVSQFYYINSNNEFKVTYTAGNIGGNSKPLDALKKIGRVHQNIHLDLVINGVTWTTYGYYGNDNTVNVSGGDGSEFWSVVSAPSLVSIATEKGKNNGKISGLDNSLTYEYKLKTSSTYTEVSSKTEITGLAEGVYEVRIKDLNATKKVTEIEVKSTTALVVNLETPAPAKLLSSINTDATSFPTDAKKAIEDGTATLNVEVKNIELTNVENKTEIAKLNSELGKNDKIATILDIDLILNYWDETYNVNELSTSQSFTIDIPENLQNKGYDFYLMNNHNGTINKIEGTVSSDGKKITFLTNKFSLYALAYNDNIANPATGDEVISFIILGGISILTILGYMIYRRKKVLNNL